MAEQMSLLNQSILICSCTLKCFPWQILTSDLLVSALGDFPLLNGYIDSYKEV